MILRDKCEMDVAAGGLCWSCGHWADERREMNRDRDAYVTDILSVCKEANRAVRNYRRRMAYAAARKGTPCATS